jgi:hypothetical protein
LVNVTDRVDKADGADRADREDEGPVLQALESLDKAYWRIGEALGLYLPSTVPVVFYPAEEFPKITHAPEWASGAYDRTIRVPLRDTLSKGEELDRVLATNSHTPSSKRWHRAACPRGSTRGSQPR